MLKSLFENEDKGEAFDKKRFYIFKQIKLILARKVFQVTSFFGLKFTVDQESEQRRNFLLLTIPVSAREEPCDKKRFNTRWACKGIHP